MVLVFDTGWSRYGYFSILKFCLSNKSVGTNQLASVNTGTSKGDEDYYVKYKMSLSDDRKTLKWWREVWLDSALYSKQAYSFGVSYDSDSFCNYSGMTYFYIAF